MRATSVPRRAGLRGPAFCAPPARTFSVAMPGVSGVGAPAATSTPHDGSLSRNRKLGASVIAVAPAKAGAQKLPASVARGLDPRPRLREDRLFAGMTNRCFLMFLREHLIRNAGLRGTQGPETYVLDWIDAQLSSRGVEGRSHKSLATPVFVAPAKSLSSRRRERGPRLDLRQRQEHWIPASAGMTNRCFLENT
jgi:hypothetical protein